MQGFEVKFNIYAETQEEADAVSSAVKDFISENAQRGVAISAAKVTAAIKRWGGNPFIKGKITNYFK